MFSPAARKSHFGAPKDRNVGKGGRDSPSTPVVNNSGAAVVPHRPTTGTPAPWASRLSVLARIGSTTGTDNEIDSDQIQPVYVGEVPQVVRKAQAIYIQKKNAGDAICSGGMDKATSLSWILYEDQIFIWHHLSPLPMKCVILNLPESVSSTLTCRHRNSWMLCIIKWNNRSTNPDEEKKQCSSAGVFICHQKNQTAVYWPDIFTDSGRVPLISLPNIGECEQCDEGSTMGDKKQSWAGSSYFSEHCPLNSMIASAIPGAYHEAVALACHYSGYLLCFHCSPTGIHQKKVSDSVGDCHTSDSFKCQSKSITSNAYTKSITWCIQDLSSGSPSQHFFLLTEHGIQCWNIILAHDPKVTKLWSHKIVGANGNLGIKRDLASQKHIWFLDLQVDNCGKELTILVATLCKDQVNGSSYTQYSLLTMQYKPEKNISIEGYMTESILKKKSLQVITPKAKVDDENNLFSMRLRVGGSPPGSAIILSRDGIATVTHYHRESVRLYQFDLPWDAGKALDASMLPSMEDSEKGSWAVLTESAGIWAIPEKAILLGAVELPEMCLSFRGSSSEIFSQEGGRIRLSDNIVASPKDSPQAPKVADRKNANFIGVSQPSNQDEEAEILLECLFRDFLLSGNAERAFEKLKSSGAFEKEGENNVFVCMSKSITDAFSKHWIKTRDAEFVASAVIVSQLMDKKHKHERFLQFLALSKCHEELSSKQRHALQIILEHGEKLYGMIQLREFHNDLSQNRSNEGQPSFGEAAGSLWDLIQLVGEKNRRNNVLLMDRDNADVFYSKISNLEELLCCLSSHIGYIVNENQHFMVQMQRASEVSNACITLIRAAVCYRDEHQMWYPPLEGLVPWNCHAGVRSGLWSIASVIIHLLKKASAIHTSVKIGLCSNLETLTDFLLEAYASSIIAKTELGEEHRGLLEEYQQRRDDLLNSLYQQSRNFTDDVHKESCKGTENSKVNEGIFREISSSLLSIAKQHEGYQTMWDICYDLQDTGLLRKLMYESVGPTGGFSYFVFEKLYEKKHYSKLLRLGEEFQLELTTYLKQHKDLLWLHEVFLNHYSCASDTLHGLAFSQDEIFAPLIEQNSELVHSKHEPSLVDRRRFLCLSKIAAAAGQNAGYENKVRTIEADLKILKLQVEIMKLCFGDTETQIASKPLSARQLIEMCLKGKTHDLSLLAFEVFAWTTSSFRTSNRSLLEKCWMNVVDQDDWLTIHQLSVTEGWTDEVRMQYLSQTLLFKASNWCYGSQARSHEGRFDEVLPLQEENVGVLKGTVSSVEDILMQHKDFPYAGKLMLSAIILGKMECIAKDFDMEL